MPRGRKPKQPETVESLAQELAEAEQAIQDAKAHARELEEKLKKARAEEEQKLNNELLNKVRLWARSQDITVNTRDLIQWFDKDTQRIIEERKAKNK